MKKMNVRTLTGMAVFTAIVVLLQFVSMNLRFGAFSITLVLLPVVVGAALYGPWAGAWLGFVFGVVVLLTGDAAAFLAVSVPGTLVTVLVKGTVAGLGAGLVYRLLEKKNTTLAVVCAAVAAPVLNTGIFLLCCLAFFMPTLTAWGQAAGMENVFVYMMVGLVGINFLIELGTNMVLAPVAVRLIGLGKDAYKRGRVR